MADEEKAEEVPVKPKKNMLLIILVAVNMLGMLGVGAYVMFFQGGGEAEAQAAPAEVAPAVPEGRFGPLVEFNPIVANLAEADATRYVKVTLHLEVANEEQQLKLEEMTIPIRDRMVLYFSGLTAEDTLGEDKKAAIKEQLKELANEVAGAEVIRNVFIGEFVVQ